MSITTYGQLKTAVATWLNRSNLTDRIPEFIALAETRIHYGSMEQPYQSEPLRIRAMENSVTATIDAQTTQLPTGFLQARRFYLNTDPIRKMDMVSTDNFWATFISTTTGEPRQFCIEGENLVVGPSPDGSYTGRLLYYKAFTTLSDESETNWLLTNASGAYLYGALIEAHKFTRNPAEAQNAYNSFMGIINSLNFADKNDRQSGSPWVARTDTGNP